VFIGKDATRKKDKAAINTLVIYSFAGQIRCRTKTQKVYGGKVQ
jgi:hypothetical protein